MRILSSGAVVKLALFAGLCLGGSIMSLLSCALPVMAETRVGGSLSGNVAWNASGSPYVLDSDIFVLSGTTLSIGPRVKIVSSAGSTNNSINVNAGGSLIIAGAPDGRVDIGGGVGHIFSDGGTVKVSYADLHTQGIDLQVYASKLDIDHSTVKDSTGSGIYSWKSAVGVADSRIEGNAYAGIYIKAGSPGGADFNVHNSALLGNGAYALVNADWSAVHAENNWWGDAGGPAHSGPNTLAGPAWSEPWLTRDPTLGLLPPPACCSSVLFIPGLEGTRLYAEERAAFAGRILGRATTTNKLWEPDRNADVRKLYLNADGTSVNPGVYSGWPVDKAYGLFGVYGDFMSFLDGLVDGGVMNEWRAFGYDWRKPVAGAVAGPERKATTTESLVDLAESMASSSKTGKVSIVAHSNGGLVAKYLVKALADAGKSALVDSIVSVAVPFAGTPMAIPALLYGDGQSMGWGLISSEANAKGLAENMGSAYSLLPSQGYFDRAAWPTIISASTTAVTASAQNSFLSSVDGVNRMLLGSAESLHAVLDPWRWPDDIARWAVAGWGKATAFAERYAPDGSHSKLTDPYGDGTVKAESASYDGGQVFSEDLVRQSDLERRDISHANILESSTTQALIADILSNPTAVPGSKCSANPASCNAGVINKISKLPGITAGEPDWKSLEKQYATSRKRLYARVHSPVALNIYDSQGRHTGEIPAPAVDLDTGEPIERGLLKRFEANIPGSDFTTDQGDDYITIPDDGSVYTIAVNGMGVGTFGLEIGRERGIAVVDAVQWTEVPVTPLSAATTTLASSADFSVSAGSLASSTASLSLDVDGDGSVDATSSPGLFDPAKALNIMRLKCPAAGRSPSAKFNSGERDGQCKGLLEKLEHASLRSRPKTEGDRPLTEKEREE